MTYTLTPAVTTGWVQVNDCASGDKPIRKSDAPTEDGAIGIIGGADGPTAVFVSGIAAQNLWGMCVKVFSNVIVIVLNYVFSKLIVFKKK